jgi:hypothetical protein
VKNIPICRCARANPAADWANIRVQARGGSRHAAMRFGKTHGYAQELREEDWRTSTRSRQELWFPLSSETIAGLYLFSLVALFENGKPQQTDVARRQFMFMRLRPPLNSRIASS